MKPEKWLQPRHAGSCYTLQDPPCCRVVDSQGSPHCHPLSLQKSAQPGIKSFLGDPCNSPTGSCSHKLYPAESYKCPWKDSCSCETQTCDDPCPENHCESIPVDTAGKFPWIHHLGTELTFVKLSERKGVANVSALPRGLIL